MDFQLRPYRAVADLGRPADALDRMIRFVLLVLDHIFAIYGAVLFPNIFARPCDIQILYIN